MKKIIASHTRGVWFSTSASEVDNCAKTFSPVPTAFAARYMDTASHRNQCKNLLGAFLKLQIKRLIFDNNLSPGYSSLLAHAAH